MWASLASTRLRFALTTLAVLKDGSRSSLNHICTRVGEACTTAFGAGLALSKIEWALATEGTRMVRATAQRNAMPNKRRACILTKKRLMASIPGYEFLL